MIFLKAALKNPKNYKIVIATMAFSFIFLLGFLYESHLSYKMEINRARIETINLTRVLQEQINGSFTIIDFVLQDLQSDVQKLRNEGKFNNEEFLKYFSKQRAHLSFVKSFKVIDKEGNYIGDDEGVRNTLNIKDREYFQQIKSTNTDKLIISKPVISKTSYIWVIVAARRLVDKNGNFNGLILGTIPLSYFREQFEKLMLGQNGVVGLFDLQLTAHARIPWIEAQIGKRIPVRPEVQEFLSRSTDPYLTLQTVSKIDGVERLSTIRRLEAFPFVVAVGLSTNDITYEWKNRTIAYGVVLTIVVSIFIIFVFIFIRSQEDLEDQRHQAIQASKLSSLGEMASGIAHEINNPLTIISALATRTKKNLKDPAIPLEKSAENQDKIIATVDRIAKIIRGLRSFSRDSNGDAFKKKKVGELIDMTMDLCSERLRDHGIDVQIDSLVDIEIECREVQIVQVLVNLLNNSSDAIAELPEKWVRISTWESGDRIYIRITDSGHGIDDKIVDKMMMPFFTTKDIGKGTGLGLSISKGIIEAHHGQLYYRKFDGYTSFVIELKKTLNLA